MTDYDYTSWQFLDAIGQASPLHDEAMSLAFEFPSPSTSTSTGNGQVMSSDNGLSLPYGQTSATGKQGYMQDSPPIEMGMDLQMGMGMGMDLEMEMEMFAQRMEFSGPTFPDLSPNFTLGHSHSHSRKAPDTPDLSLLRSTSLNAAAAERALFMTPSVTSPLSSPSSSSSSSSSSLSSSSSNQHSSPSLDLDPCTPSTTSTSSKESDEDGDCDWDHPTATNLHYYKLPDRLSLDSSSEAGFRPPRVHHHHHHQNPYRENNHRDSNSNTEEEAEELTPLEMPDGSTRFTANWLPVDPTGGFTIGSEFGERRAVSVSASASAVECGYAYGHEYGEQDHAFSYGYADPVSLELEFSKEAFIQVPALAPV